MTDMPTPPASADVPTTPTEPPRRWNWRPKARWFAAEYLIVVLGVLTAVAINAWWQGRQDAASEANYLALVSRDLHQMVANLEELSAFEAQQFEDGVRAYHLLSEPGLPPERQAEVSRLLARLTDRRTVSVVDAAYEDLVSTGNLRLIRDRRLRDQIVSFHEEAGRVVEIHNRNNWLFVDGLFVREVYGRGLFLRRPGSNIVGTTGRDSVLHARLAGGYIEDADAAWAVPQTAPEWDLVRGQLLMRIDIASIARGQADRLLESARELREVVEAEQDQ